MRYLLLTQCLQNDFVGPLPAGAPLPNGLHIGRAESRRLLGEPGGEWASEGPLARFLSRWGAGGGPNHHALHVRDWHDPEDPATRGHLAHFGAHCLRGSQGARFVAPLEQLLEQGRGHRVVDSAILSDFVGTDLEAALRTLPGEGPIRAGLVGVWTDVKVHYLAYELVARLGLDEVAVCSALTASRSRQQHRLALEQMAANLGVRVVDSLPEFASWLGLDPSASPLTERPGAAVRVALPEGQALDDEERRLVEHLFRDCREVRAEPLSGGFSGSRVFRATAVDRQGLEQVPYVVKLDTHERIARERVGVESVEGLLGAASPRLVDYVDLETRGAIKYQFATMHGGDVRTLQKALRAAGTPDEARRLLTNVATRVLARLYQRPQREDLQLFSYYGFGPQYAPSTLRRVSALAESESGDVLRVSGLAGVLPHPRRVYGRLARFLADEPRETAVTWIHGDLNLANLLLDESGNVWMIDYFWTRTGHALQDLAKLENDLKFILLPLPDDEALRRAAEWDELLVSGPALEAAPPTLPAPLAGDAALARVHAAVEVLRTVAARLLGEAGFALPHPAREYRIAQLRYAAHTLSFDECDPRQKRLALASACRLAGGLDDLPSS